MATLLESKAAFAKRVTELGLEDVAAEFESRGWDTFAAFAFSSSYSPSASDDTPFRAVIQEILGAADCHLNGLMDFHMSVL